MAYITQIGSRWRAQIEKRGKRASKCHATKEDAELWVKFMEAQIVKKADTLTMRERVAMAESLLATAVPKRVLRAMSQLPHSLEDVLDAAIPLSGLCGIYFLIKDKEVVYVGQSVNVLHRIGRHWAETKEFDGYAFMECKREDMDHLEAVYIEAFVPELNLALGKVPARARLFEA